MKLTDKERNTCAALLCRWAARDNELMASDLYGSSQYYKLLGALTALRTLGLMAETVFSDAPAPGGYYNFGKIMLDGMVYDVPEPKEEMENEYKYAYFKISFDWSHLRCGSCDWHLYCKIPLQRCPASRGCQGIQ